MKNSNDFNISRFTKEEQEHAKTALKNIIKKHIELSLDDLIDQFVDRLQGLNIQGDETVTFEIPIQTGGLGLLTLFELAKDDLKSK